MIRRISMKWQSGEAATTANAIFAATAARVHGLLIRPEAVLAAFPHR